MSAVSLAFYVNTQMQVSVNGPLGFGKSRLVKLTNKLGSTQFTIGDQNYQIFNSQIWANAHDAGKAYTFNVEISESIDSSRMINNSIVIDILHRKIAYYFNYDSGYAEFGFWVVRANEVLVSENATIGTDLDTQNITQISYDAVANSTTSEYIDTIPPGFSAFAPPVKKVSIPWDKLIAIILMGILVCGAVIALLWALSYTGGK